MTLRGTERKKKKNQNFDFNSHFDSLPFSRNAEFYTDFYCVIF